MKIGKSNHKAEKEILSQKKKKKPHWLQNSIVQNHLFYSESQPIKLSSNIL